MHNLSFKRELSLKAQSPYVARYTTYAMWASHPRVFLDIAATGHVACPYCGTKYKLKEGEVVGHHH
jgi:uncharacterized Zn-finger protein